MTTLASRYRAAVWLGCAAIALLALTHFPWRTRFGAAVLGAAALLVIAFLINDEAP